MPHFGFTSDNEDETNTVLVPYRSLKKFNMGLDMEQKEICIICREILYAFHQVSVVLKRAEM